MLESTPRQNCQVSDDAPTSAKRLRVLVYEATNDPERMLKDPRAGWLDLFCDVEWVGTLGEAVEHVRTDWFDVVLLDFNISGANPGLFVRRLKESALTHPIPIVVRSHEPCVEQAVSSFTAGAANYIVVDELDPQETRAALEAAAAACVRSEPVEGAHVSAQAVELENPASENPVEQYALALTHSVLTPLAAVQEFVSLVLDGVTGHISDEQGKQLAYARGGCETIRTSVLRGLDSTRYGSDWNADTLNVDIEKLLGMAWDEAYDVAGGTPKALNIDCSVSNKTVTGDVSYLTGLLGDLFKDALSFAGADGDVEVAINSEALGDARLLVVITTQSANAIGHETEGTSPLFSNERSYRGVRVTQTVGRELEYRIALTAEKMQDPAIQNKLAEMV